MHKREHRCGFTSYRPVKLPFGYAEVFPDCVSLKQRLDFATDRMFNKGITTFIRGVAQGVDIWAAERVLELKSAKPSGAIRLEAILPYEGQADRWSERYRERYFNILAAADRTVILHARYARGCMQTRNRAIVDASAHLIAIFGGRPGGTAHTIDYARAKGLDIAIIDPREIG